MNKYWPTQLRKMEGKGSGGKPLGHAHVTSSRESYEELAPIKRHGCKIIFFSKTIHRKANIIQSVLGTKHKIV